MADDPYSYPGTDVLRNKLGITNDADLTKAEQRYSTARGRLTVTAFLLLG